MPDVVIVPGMLLLAAVGALVAPLPRSVALGRVLAMASMLGILALALHVVFWFDGAAAAPGPWQADFGRFPALGLSLRFGVDGVNLYLVLLTALLFPVVLACAWNGPEGRSRLYLGLLLTLECGLLGTFLAQNLLVLFVLWEAVLIPMVLLIVVFGGPQRRRAALTFFLYTMAGSVLFLAAVLLLGFEAVKQTVHWSFDLDVLARLHLPPGEQAFVFVAIALACAVKSPLVPFHAWLPLAYREASPSGTALMAGVMSKMGAFGFLRLAIPLCPDVAPPHMPLMIGLAVLSILYGAVLALRQTDYKLLMAYASLSHMGYIVLGTFSFQSTGLHGALFQMLSHGVTVAGLFLMLGLLEQRRGPAWLQLDALATRAPRFAVVLMLFVLASLALPLSSGFTAEFLVLLGAFTQGLATWRADAGIGLLVAALAAGLGVVLGATYMLRFARVLVWGVAAGDAGGSAGHGAAPGAHGAAGGAVAGPLLPDLTRRELGALVPLLAVVLWVGVWPGSLMPKVEPAVARLVAIGAPPARTAAAPAAAVPAAAAPLPAAPAPTSSAPALTTLATRGTP